jgi:hypothetical protein
MFATAPVIDVDELRSDLDALVTQELRDPYAGAEGFVEIVPVAERPNDL